MKSGKIKYLVIAASIITVVLLAYYENRSTSASDKNRLSGPVNKIDPDFANYIGSFTSGYISTHASIKIKFSKEFAGSTQLNTPLSEKYFSFEPEIEGETFWRDAQTLEFVPKGSLKPDQLYKASFHLNKLIEVKKELQKFEFQFQTIGQSIQLISNDLKSYNSNDFNYYSLSGIVSTADFADKTSLEKTLLARLDEKELKIKWVHDEKGTSHHFLIDSIERPTSNDAKLQLTCNGTMLEVEYVSSQNFVVPARDKFSLLNVKVITESDPYVLINFSNPIDPTQSLDGIVSIIGLSEVKYIVNNNQVLVYPLNTKTGSYILKIDQGLKDSKSQKIAYSSEHSIVFSQVKPEVRFVGSGNILPSTNGLYLNFETVNLKAVDVKIVKIFENNVLQFLQTNTMDGSSQLSQVGKMVVKKRLNLGITNPADFGQWKRSSLDLGSLFKSEPGAIYRVTLSIKKSYSTYPCMGNSNDAKFDMEEIKQEEEDEEINYFGYYDEENSYSDYDYEDGEDYNWEDRDNPCKAYYYTRGERTVARNILASDLGLTLKQGNDGSLFIAANDLVSTKPINNAKVELYDYQKQLIQVATTNADGLAFITPGKKAYFIVAKKDKNFAYLRVDDGATLPLSMYDVSGEAIKKGIKGFIYGERGVWRPGDSLFLNFILEDKLGNLPANHPIVFELYNPQGQLFKRLLSNKGTDGFYNFNLITDKNAPTGLWNAQVKVGSVRFNKSIRIEAIMPNRLKIDLKIGNEKMIVAAKDNVIKLHTNWLTGAVAKNLDTKISVALSGMQTEFSKFKDYDFDDQVLRFEGQNISVFDGKVDEQGNADIPLTISLEKNAPGFLKASFNTMVMEQGGAFSVDHFSTTYSPYSFYTGIKLPTGEKNSGILYTGRDHLIQIATVDANGNAVSRPDLKFELYKMEWRWWWDQYNSELANYATDEYHKPIQTEHIASKNGYAQVKVNINENNWGRYLIRVTDMQGGHSTSAITYFDWANWMERGGGADTKIMSNALSFTTDKLTYKTNEEVKVIIPSPKNGRALITIENGSKVMEAHWLETEKGSTIFKFKVTPQMAPTIYVHVSLIQPHSRTNDLPIRLYGVVPVSIDDPETHLKPAISTAKTLEPEKNASIVVSEENNKEMAFTLAVVDEGLLDITRFKTPDPFRSFYAKEALGVKTWDVYDNVIGAYGAELERILSIGGDGSEVNKDGAKANRFKPMVRFFGPYHLAKGEKKTINFKMPMYVGSVRSMVIAAHKGAYGFAERSTPVKAPLMILGTLPRVLSVTEEVKLPVSIFGGDKNIGKTDVKIEINGLLQAMGPQLQSVSIKKDEEKLLVFDLKVKNQTGIARVKITASGGGHTATYEMELDIRNPNPFQSVIKDFFVESGKTIQETFTAPGVMGTNSGVLEISTLPPINLEERLNYLISYPHGCVEQTTSQSFAQLHINDILDLPIERKNQIDNYIRIGIQELSKFQLSSGGLSYWQGSGDENEWGTSYAGHFLLLAEKKGYTLPSSFKKNWINYQQKRAQNFEINEGRYYSSDEVQAYRLYSLTLANAPVIGAMNRLREYSKLSNTAKWLLASAYAQIGQLDESEKLITQANALVKPYRINYFTYGSSDRDLAIVLQTYCLMNKKTQAFTQLKKVAEFLSSKTWLSTQTTAFALVSVADFIKKFGGASSMQAICNVNGKASNLSGSIPISQIPIVYKNTVTGTFKIENNGKGVLFVRLINRGKPPIGEEKESNENIATTVIYKDMNGNVISPDALIQGTNFMVSITVRNLGAMGEIKNLALNNYIPSGWEIHNARMDDNEAVLKNSSFTYQDIRDDRVLTYFDLQTNETKTFNLLLNAAYEGKYYLPAVNIEAMYDNTIYARTKGQWIRVVKSTNQSLSQK